MVGQNAQVQHFRVGDEHRGRIVAYLAPEMIAGVAVVQGGAGTGVLRPMGGQSLEGGPLVLGQGLEREQIQPPGVPILKIALQNGEIIDQGFAAGRGGGDHHVAPGPDQIGGPGLVAVQGGDTRLVQHTAYGFGPGADAFGKGGGPILQHLVAGHLSGQFGRGQKRGDIVGDVAVGHILNLSALSLLEKRDFL